MAVDPYNIGIQMNQKELTNWKKTFGFYGFFLQNDSIAFCVTEQSSV